MRQKSSYNLNETIQFILSHNFDTYKERSEFNNEGMLCVKDDVKSLSKKKKVKLGLYW